MRTVLAITVFLATFQTWAAHLVSCFISDRVPTFRPTGLQTLLKARQGSNLSNMAIFADHGLSPFQGHIQSSFYHSDANLADLISSCCQVLTVKEWGSTKADINTMTCALRFQT